MTEKSIKHSWARKLHFFFSRAILLAKLFLAYLYDARHFMKHSSTLVPCTQTKDMLEFRILAHSHVIEKGLSFKEVKLNFAQDVIHNLLFLLEVYQKKHGPACSNSFAYNVGGAILSKYIEFHQKQHQDISQLTSRFKRLNDDFPLELAGTKELNRDDILQAQKGDFLEFIKSRHSIRNFTNEVVPLESVYKAIEIAQYSPSACNRQSARVFIVRAPQLVKLVLKYQNGNRGFGHLVTTLLAVTSNTNAYEGVQERNQAFIDGGIYTMNLLYGLHYEGLCTCCLGWLSDLKTDRLLKKELALNSAERVIDIIAVGQMPEHFRVAESKRKPWNNICTIV